MPARDVDPSLVGARFAAQRLVGAADSAVEATRHLLAVQAQDPRAARLAVRVRSRAERAADVDDALTTERSLVITWANRGTLHLIAAEDEPLLHALTTPQLRSASERRLRNVGIDAAAADRGITAIRKSLASDGPMTRTEIKEVLDRVRVPTAGQALIQLLFRATIEGLIVRGPLVGADHAFVLAADWLGPRPKIDRDRALAELARRYLVAHGPAGADDLAKWAQLPLRDTRAALRAIGAELEELPGGLVDLRRTRVATSPPPLLLGPFDPLLLGWRSREFFLGEPKEVITVNGIIRAIALVDGRAAGTWAIRGGRVSLSLWDQQPAATIAALEAEAVAVSEYLAGQ
jgi:Winged helix DNA-binding domain